jgi:hypothetical protein
MSSNDSRWTPISPRHLAYFGLYLFVTAFHRVASLSSAFSMFTRFEADAIIYEADFFHFILRLPSSRLRPPLIFMSGRQIGRDAAIARFMLITSISDYAAIAVRIDFKFHLMQILRVADMIHALYMRLADYGGFGDDATS